MKNTKCICLVGKNKQDSSSSDLYKAPAPPHYLSISARQLCIGVFPKNGTMVDTAASLVHWTGHLHWHRNHTTPGFACEWTLACAFRQTGDQLTFQPWPSERTIRGNGNKQACLFNIFVILSCIWRHKHAVPGRMKMSLHATVCLHIHHLSPQRRLLCISSFTFPLFLGTNGSNWNKKCKQMIVCESIIYAARQICGIYKQPNMLKCPLMLSYGTKLLLIKDNCRRWTFHQHWNYILVFKIASLWIQTAS